MRDLMIQEDSRRDISLQFRRCYAGYRGKPGCCAA